MTTAERAAWIAFREALTELGRTDPERARLYLEGAACSLRDWTRSLRQHPPAPRGPGRNSGEPR